jgi:hypothetical protein
MRSLSGRKRETEKETRTARKKVLWLEVRGEKGAQIHPIHQELPGERCAGNKVIIVPILSL